MFNKGFIFFSLLFLIGSGLDAQILRTDGFGNNVDSTHRLVGAVNLGANINRQNSLILTFDTKADLAYLFKQHVVILAGKFNFFRGGGQTLVKGGFSHFRLRLAQDKMLHPEFFTQYQLDEVRGLKERILAGSNLRLRLKEYDKGAFFMGLGLMYENELWTYRGVPSNVVIVDNTPIRNHFIKLNAYVTYRQKVSNSFDISTVLYFQTRPDSYFVKPRVSSTTQFNFKINRHFSFMMKYDVFYDALPPVPVYNLYYSVINSLAYTF